LSHHGDDAIGCTAKLGSDGVGFNAEFLDGILHGYICDRVDIAVVDGSAVDELSAGVWDTSGNLIVPGRESVAVHPRYCVAGLGSTLGHDTWRKRQKIEHIAAIQRQFGYRSTR